MAHFVGLDVSVKKTNICIVDAEHRVVAEGKVITDPEAIAMYLYDQGYRYERIGLETGSQSAFLYQGLARAGYPATVICAKHANDVLKMNINKNDRNDARGIARIMAGRMYKPIHVKTNESRDDRVLLGARRSLQIKMTSGGPQDGTWSWSCWGLPGANSGRAATKDEAKAATEAAYRALLERDPEARARIFAHYAELHHRDLAREARRAGLPEPDLVEMRERYVAVARG